LQDPALLQKSQIKPDIVSHNGRVPDKSFQVLGNILELGSTADFHIADTGQSRDKFRDMFTRVDEGGPFLFNAMPLELHRPNFDDRVTVLA
jgi:hypothetical protein